MSLQSGGVQSVTAGTKPPLRWPGVQGPMTIEVFEQLQGRATITYTNRIARERENPLTSTQSMSRARAAASQARANVYAGKGYV